MQKQGIHELYASLQEVQSKNPLSSELLDGFIALKKEISALLQNANEVNEEAERKLMKLELDVDMTVYELFSLFIQDGYNRILTESGTTDEKLILLGIKNYRINRIILPPECMSFGVTSFLSGSNEGGVINGLGNKLTKKRNSFDIDSEYPKTLLLVKILFEAGIGSNNYIVITGSADKNSLRPFPYRIFFIPGCATIIINDGINQATFLSEECIPIGNLLKFGKSSLTLLKKINRRTLDNQSREDQIMQFIKNLDLSKKTSRDEFEAKIRSTLGKKYGEYSLLLTIDDRIEESKSRGFYKKKRSEVTSMIGGHTFLRYFHERNKQFSKRSQEVHRGLLFARICKSLDDCKLPDDRLEYAKEHGYYGKNTSELRSVSGGLNFNRKLKERSKLYYSDEPERNQFVDSILKPKIQYAVSRKTLVHSGTTIEDRLQLKSDFDTGLTIGLTAVALRNEFTKRNKDQKEKKKNKEKLYPSVRHDRSNLTDEQWRQLLSTNIHPISGKTVTRNAAIKAYNRINKSSHEKE